MVKADLHNHLRTSSRIFSGDFDKVAKITRFRLGFDGIIGVVNFSDNRYEKLIQCPGYERVDLENDGSCFYVPDLDVYIMKGQEVPTKEGHLLVLGIGKNVHLKDGRSLDDTVKEAKDNRGIILADHPFYSNGVGNYLRRNPDFIENLDAIEVHNGEAGFSLPFSNYFPPKANEKAQEFFSDYFLTYAQKNDLSHIDSPELGAIYSSDGHSFYEIGSSYTELTSAISQIDFLNSLRTAIHKTGNRTEGKQSNSKLGALDHIVDLAFITQIAPRIGLGKFFAP